MDFGVKKTVKERAASLEKRYGATTKGTAEKAKPEPWKVTSVRISDGGKSFSIKAKKEF